MNDNMMKPVLPSAPSYGFGTAERVQADKQYIPNNMIVSSDKDGPTGHVEHDDRALALDVVAVPQPPKPLLARRVPDVELDGTSVRVEDEGVDLDACAEHRSNRVRIHSKSKNKPPTTSSPGDESHRWREGVSTLQNTEIRTAPVP